MASQLSHSTTSFDSRTFPIVLLCNDVRSPANIGGLFRIADAFGIEKIIFCGLSIDFSSSRIKRTARSSHENVQYKHSEDIIHELEELKAVGYYAVGLEITDTSIPLNTLTTVDEKIAIVVGNERQGIDQDVLGQLDKTVHIDMYGANSSMNVVQATGIALYQVTNHLKQLVE